MRKLKNEELGRLNIKGFQEADKFPLIIVLDNVRSLNNVGSAFRTADAFRIEKIYLCGITGTPPHREINKTALGATESVEWEYRENIEDVFSMLKNEGCKIAAVEQADNSTELQSFQPGKDKWAFVFGNEVEGVSEKLVQSADKVLEIPQFGTKHSINISVSIGIVVWDIINKTGILDS